MKPQFRLGILIETPIAFVTPNYSVKFTKPPAHLFKRITAVTCYFRHLTQIFEKADIEVTPANRQEIERIIHDIVSVNYKNCPAAWRQVKRLISEDEATFVSKLKAAWKKRK